MSAELTGILGVGIALTTLILTAALWMGGWLRALDGSVGKFEQRLEPLDGLIDGSGLFRPAGLSKAAAGDSSRCPQAGLRWPPKRPLYGGLLSCGNLCSQAICAKVASAFEPKSTKKKARPLHVAQVVLASSVRHQELAGHEAALRRAQEPRHRGDFRWFASSP